MVISTSSFATVLAVMHCPLLPTFPTTTNSATNTPPPLLPYNPPPPTIPVIALSLISPLHIAKPLPISPLSLLPRGPRARNTCPFSKIVFPNHIPVLQDPQVVELGSIAAPTLIAICTDMHFQIVKTLTFPPMIMNPRDNRHRPKAISPVPPMSAQGLQF